MNKHALTTLALLEAGDVKGLLALNRDRYGEMVMTIPATEPAVVIPAAPPAPAPTVQQIPADILADPRVAAAVEAARKQEKDKLYETIEAEKQRVAALEQQMSAFSTDLTTRQQAEEAALKAAADAAEEKRLAELSFGEKLSEFQAQMTQQVGGLQTQLEQSQAIIAKEREFNELMQYRNTALTNEDPNGPGRGLGPQIIPQMRDLVLGNNREEIEASISALAERSASILSDVATATAGRTALPPARGVGVTAPPVGPLDNDSGYQTLSLEELQAMDMTQYSQLRGRLLGAASQQQQGRGMFG
jgi:hypothetical protein